MLAECWVYGKEIIMARVMLNGKIKNRPDQSTLKKIGEADKLLNHALKRENAKSNPSPIAVSRIRERLLRNKNNELSVLTSMRKNRFANKDNIEGYFTLKDLGDEAAAGTTAPVSIADKLKAFFTTGTGASLISAGTSLMAQKQEAAALKQREATAEAERKAYEAAAAAYKPTVSKGIELTSSTLLLVGGIAAIAAYALSRKGGKKRR